LQPFSLERRTHRELESLGLVREARHRRASCSAEAEAEAENAEGAATTTMPASAAVH
jgi:hypothetical protein